VWDFLKQACVFVPRIHIDALCSIMAVWQLFSYIRLGSWIAKFCANVCCVHIYGLGTRPRFHTDMGNDTYEAR